VKKTFGRAHLGEKIDRKTLTLPASAFLVLEPGKPPNDPNLGKNQKVSISKKLRKARKQSSGGHKFERTTNETEKPRIPSIEFGINYFAPGKGEEGDKVGKD